MKRAFWAAAAALLLSACAFAQGFTTVTASHIQNASGTALSSGQICFQGTDANDQPISFRAGGSGGQVIASKVCKSISAGTISGGGISVADTALTAPVNVCYRVTVTDLSTGQVVLYYPQAQSSPKCGPQPTGTTWSLDSYQPNLAPQALMQNGPTGPRGPIGFVYKGEWGCPDPDHPFYDANDAVQYNNSLWKALQSAPCGTLGTPAENSFWTNLLTSAIGPQGTGFRFRKDIGTPAGNFPGTGGFPDACIATAAGPSLATKIGSYSTTSGGGESGFTISAVPTVGHTFLIFVWGYNGFNGITSITASDGTVMTADLNFTANPGSIFRRPAVYRYTNVATTLTGATAAFSTGGQFVTAVAVDVDQLLSSPVDVKDTVGNSTAAGTSWTSSSLTLTNANDIVFDWVLAPGVGTHNPVPTSPATLLWAEAGTSNNAGIGILSQRITSATGAVVPGGSYDDTSSVETLSVDIAYKGTAAVEADPFLENDMVIDQKATWYFLQNNIACTDTDPPPTWPTTSNDFWANVIPPPEKGDTGTSGNPRTALFPFGARNAQMALVDADLGPQDGFQITEDATLLEINIQADGGTPSIMLERSRCTSFSGGACTAYTTVDLLSAALATRSSGVDKCALSSTSGTCQDGQTSSSSITIQNTTLLKGDIIRPKSGTATGSPKSVTVQVVWQ